MTIRTQATKRTGKRRTSRVAVTQSSTTPSLSVHAPSQVVAGSDSANVAAGLAQALGLAGDASAFFAERSNEKDFNQAQVDKQTGTLRPEDERTAAYNRAVSQMDADADWAVDRLEIEEALTALDTDSMSEEELNGFIDGEFRKRYEGLEDLAYAERMLPNLEGFRTDKLTAHAQDQITVAREKQASNLQLAMRDELETTGEFNYAKLGDLTGTLRDGAERNVMYARVLFDAAIDLGMPELLDNMPDRHANGVPTIKNIPAWQEKIRNARAQAAAALAGNQKLIADGIKQAREALEFQMAVRAVNGEDYSDLFAAYSVMPGRQDTVVTSLTNAGRSARNDTNKFDSDFDAITALEYRLYTGTADYNDILQARFDGTLGGADVAKSEAGRLFNIYQEARENERRRDQTDPTIRTARGALERSFAIERDPFSRVPIAGQADRVAVLNRAFEEYDRLIAGGADPWKTADELREKYIATAERSATSKIQSSEALKPSAAIQSFVDGTGNVVELHRSNVRAEQVAGMVDANQISEQDAAQLLKELREYRSRNVTN